MSQYIAFHASLRQPNLDLAALGPLFRTELFRPVGIAGAFGQASIVEGYGLEPYVDDRRTRSRLSPLQSLRPEDGRHRAYLRFLEEGGTTTFRLDMFETAHMDYPLTVLDAPTLSEDVLTSLSNELRGPGSVVRLYGTFALCVSGVEAPDTLNAFRAGVTSHQPQDKAITFRLILSISIGQRANGGKDVYLSVFSESDVWLGCAQALGGRIGPMEAEANLARFALLTRLSCSGADIVSTHLACPSPLFLRERERIENAFGTQITAW